MAVALPVAVSASCADMAFDVLLSCKGGGGGEHGDIDTCIFSCWPVCCIVAEVLGSAAFAEESLEPVASALCIVASDWLSVVGSTSLARGSL